MNDNATYDHVVDNVAYHHVPVATNNLTYDEITTIKKEDND